MGRKFLACAVIFAFLFASPLSLAADKRTAETTALIPSASIPAASYDPLKIKISPEYGKIMETFAPKGKGIAADQRIVVHVQDLHVNYEAQTNIAKILGELAKKYGITRVCVEGSTGKLDVSFFRDFPDKKARNETTEHFVKRGQITGPEFLAITSDMPIELYGIETKERYLAHLDVFNDYYKRMKDATKAASRLNTILASLRAKLYTKDLKELEKRSDDFAQKKLPITNYTFYLNGIASKKGVDLSSHQNFSLLCTLIDLEKAMDFKRVELERKRLIEAVSKRIDKKSAKELLDKSLGFKSGEVSEAEFYDYLENHIDRSKDVEEYPNLVKYIDYTKKQSGLDNAALFHELGAVEGIVKEALAKNAAQKELVRLSKNAKFLKEMFELKLTIEQYAYYEANKDEFAPSGFLKFVDENAKKNNVSYSADFSGVLNAAYNDNIASLEKFYELGLARDEALLDNALKYMKDSKAKAIVMITGGFHTKGITDRMKKENIAYAVISPNVTRDQDDELYFEVLSGKTEPLEEALEENSERVSE